MIIGNDDFDKDNPQRKSPATYVVPEKEIRALIGGLRINKSYDVTVRLGAAALAVVQSMQNRIKSKSNEANILLLKQLAQEYKNKQFQELIDAVIAAIEPEKDDFNSAFLTLARALEFVYGSLPVYSAAREFYEEKMSDIGKTKG
jgi:hypothetical protein